MSYPVVYGEEETIKKLKKGFSIARFGDGEFGIMQGGGYDLQIPNSNLSRELAYILDTPSDCLIGIPTMDERGDKYSNWIRHKDRYAAIIPDNREYYSAFISRPDCGEWMRTKSYAEKVQSLWTEKAVAVIAPARGQLLQAVQLTQTPYHIECYPNDAYQQIDSLESQALSSGKELILISCGPTATCLAYRLSQKVQALDLGSLGGFLHLMLTGGTLTPEMAHNTAKL